MPYEHLRFLGGKGGHGKPDGGVGLEFVSEAIERVTGYPVSDFLGEAPRRVYGPLIHPKDRARVAAAVDEAVAGDRPYLIEYRLIHADGSERWVWENGTAVSSEDGTARWLDGVVLDITERRSM